MLFGFRAIRAFQVLLAIIALAMGIGCALALKIATDEGAILPLVIAVILGGVFLMTFAAALRAPTSFVAVGDERTRIRFSPFIDRVIPNSQIVAVRVVRHPWWGGIGVRTDLRGTVALATASGPVAEIELREPVRVWAIPRLWALRAERLRLSIRHPEKLAERFPAAGETGSAGDRRSARRRR